jgi:Protein of unknown function (DUF4012)
METRARGTRRTRRTRRNIRTRRFVVLGVLAVLLVWGAFVAFTLVKARHDTRTGIDALHSVQQQLTPGQLLRGEGVSQLRIAQADFTRARHRVRSPLVAPLRIVPFLGRQVDSVDTLTGSAAHVVSIGITAVEQSRAVVDAGHPTGAARVRLVDQLATIADRSSYQLKTVDLGPEHLLGPLANARSEFATRLHDLRHAITQLQLASHGLADFLRGPTRYLVLAGNNGEMRVGSGTFLEIGMLTVNQGTLHLDSMKSVGQFPVPPGAVPLTGSLAGRWGFLQPNVEWRNLGASPQFPAEARLASQMWRAATGQTVNGVLALDVVALKSLLQATGPVHLADGTTMTADQVLSDVMLRQYLGIVGYPDQTTRRDRLSEIARGALDDLDHGGWHAADLVDDLRGAAQGRHLLAWSPGRAEQAGWTAAGIDGKVPTDAVLVGLHNRGGNKLDQFVNIHGQVGVARAPRPTSGAGWDVTLDLQLQNVTPATGIPQYVQGPYPGAAGAAAGLYQGYAVFELPRFAGSIHLTVDGRAASLVTAGPDGTSQVVAAFVQIPRGTSRRVVATFTVPTTERSLLFAPSARVPAIAWKAPSLVWSDDVARRVAW